MSLSDSHIRGWKAGPTVSLQTFNEFKYNSIFIAKSSLIIFVYTTFSMKKEADILPNLMFGTIFSQVSETFLNSDCIHFTINKNSFSSCIHNVFRLSIKLTRSTGYWKTFHLQDYWTEYLLHICQCVTMMMTQHLSNQICAQYVKQAWLYQHTWTFEENLNILQTNL